MIIAMAELAPQFGRRDAMLEVLHLVSNRVKHSPECLSSRVYEALDESEEILYVERWNSQQGLNSHIESALYLRVLQAFELASKPPVIGFHTISETQSLNHVEEIRTKEARRGR